MTAHASPETKQVARNMHTAGVPVARIATQLGVSQRAVYRWLGPDREDEAEYLMSEILFLRSQGEHPVMVAEVLHHDRAALLLMARRHNRPDVTAALSLDNYEERLWRGTAWSDVPGVGRARAS